MQSIFHSVMAASDSGAAAYSLICACAVVLAIKMLVR
jgi:hypothetical protein